ncbi:MAG: hypothetical protein GY719_18580 [bacterium]|nr:hypothetical protein [bacterium]
MARELQDLAATAEEEAVGQLLAATARIDDQSSQSDILQVLLEEGRRFASRAAFFLTRPGEVRGWSSDGFGREGARLRDLQIEQREGDVWERLVLGAGAIMLDSDGCAEVCNALGAPAGSRGVLIPFVLRGQLGGALYADLLEGEGSLGAASLQLLTHSAAQAIETAAVRGGGSSPTLRVGTEAGDHEAVSPWQPAAAAAAAAAGVAAAIVAAEEPPEAEVATEPEAEETPEAVDEPVEAVPEAAAEPEVEEAPEEEPAAAEPVADSAAEEIAPLEEAVEPAEPAEDMDFEVVPAVESGEPPTLEPEEEVSEEELEADLAPEPELEDTTDIWGTAEEDATYVTPAPAAEPETVEPTPPIEPPIEPPVGQETVRLDLASIQSPPAVAAVDAVSEEETAKLPQWDVEPQPEAPSQADFELEPEDETQTGYELEPEPSEPLTEPMSTPDFSTPAPDYSEDPTIMTSAADLGVDTSPMAGGYVPPPVEVTPPPTEVTPPSTEVTPPSTEVTPPSTEVTPPKPDGTGSTQVVPPTDIQGPGSAFGATESGIPAGEEALHEEARRLARLLVSEIKLYNEEIIEEGRRSGNIYERLKDDIDRSRQMYEERIDPRLLESDNDYFRQELVQRLAGGDERLLGY